MDFRHDRMTTKELLRLHRMNALTFNEESLNKRYSTYEIIKIIELLSTNYPFPSLYFKEDEDKLNLGETSKFIGFIFRLLEGQYDQYISFNKEEILYKEFIIYIAYDVTDTLEEEKLNILQKII